MGIGVRAASPQWGRLSPDHDDEWRGRLLTARSFDQQRHGVGERGQQHCGRRDGCVCRRPRAATAGWRHRPLRRRTAARRRSSLAQCGRHHWLRHYARDGQCQEVAAQASAARAACTRKARKRIRPPVAATQFNVTVTTWATSFIGRTRPPKPPPTAWSAFLPTSIGGQGGGDLHQRYPAAGVIPARCRSAGPIQGAASTGADDRG